MLFVHYVITRFNIPASGWQHDKNNKVVRDDTYYAKRISLFEQFTLPSMINQTCKNYIWLVYFDPNSPNVIKEKIKQWQLACSNFKPCYSDDYDKWQFQEMSDYIKSENSQVDYYITTRIDNDDAFHCSAIEKIQRAFIPQDNVIIDLPNGYCYNTQTYLFSKHTFVSGPFVSYIESGIKSHIDTVYREGHPAWKGKAEFVPIKDDRLWIQVIHDSNISNSQHGYICFNPNCHPYNVNDGIKRQSFRIILKEQFKQRYYLFKHKIKMLLSPKNR